MLLCLKKNDKKKSTKTREKKSTKAQELYSLTRR